MRGRLPWEYAAVVGLWLVGLAAALSYGTPGLHGGDFVYDFYPAAKQVLHGYLRYRPPPYTAANVNIFRYPPFAAVLIAPFALLTMHTAYYAWTALSIVLVGVTAVLMSRLVTTHRALTTGAVFAGLMAFAPVGESLAGVDVWILAPIAAVIVLTRRTDDSRPIAAGFLLGAVVAFKLYPALTLVVFLYTKPPGIRKIMLGFAGGLIVTTGLTIAVIGLTPFHDYFKIATTSSIALTATPFAYGALNLASRLLTHNPYAHSIANISPRLLTIAFVGYVGIALLVVASRIRSLRWGVQWSVALLGTAACSPFLEDQHLAWIGLVPFLLVVESQYPRDLAVWLIGIAAGCTFLAHAAPNHVAEAVSAVVAIGASLYAYRRLGGATAIVTGGMLLLATPSFAAIGAFWPPPISTAHVLIGSLDFVAVLVVSAGALLTEAAVRHPRRRRYVSQAMLVTLQPVFRYSASRDAYVLKGIGGHHGPVLRSRR